MQPNELFNGNTVMLSYKFELSFEIKTVTMVEGAEVKDVKVSANNCFYFLYALSNCNRKEHIEYVQRKFVIYVTRQVMRDAPHKYVGTFWTDVNECHVFELI